MSGRRAAGTARQPARRAALVTRPAEDSGPLADDLRALGLDPVAAPLLEIVPADVAAPDLDGCRAIAATSAHGIRVLARLTDRRDIPVWAVGGHTAAAAAELGFAVAGSGTAGADDLADRMVAAMPRPADGWVLHAAGAAVAGDLTGRLEAAGVAARRIVLYDARPVAALPAAARRALAGNHLAVALFLSPRTAEHFATLAGRAALDEACRPVIAACLSPRVATSLGALPWRDVRVAAEANLPSLLTCVAESIREFRRRPAAARATDGSGELA